MAGKRRSIVKQRKYQRRMASGTWRCGGRKSGGGGSGGGISMPIISASARRHERAHTGAHRGKSRRMAINRKSRSPAAT